MANNTPRYKDLERILTILLIVAALDFVLFLVVSGMGLIWVKVLTSIFAILMPTLCLAWLYLTKEFLRQRSLWLTTGFGGILVCTVVSLLAGFPAPSL